MSVIVKGMKMPDCCASCPLLEYDEFAIDGYKDHWCNALDIGMSIDELPEGRRKDCPLVDEEPVKCGKWVDDAMGVLRCSECKTQAPWKYGRDYIDYRWKANYCPNCGADMRGEEEWTK